VALIREYPTYLPAAFSEGIRFLLSRKWSSLSSSRDELIEDVLRHLLATEKQLTFFEDNIGLQFTIYQTRQELTKYGKSRSNADVRKSLKVLHKSNLAVYRADHYKNGNGDALFSVSASKSASFIP
jgi:hypothetical protein